MVIIESDTAKAVLDLKNSIDLSRGVLPLIETNICVHSIPICDTALETHLILLEREVARRKHLKNFTNLLKMHEKALDCTEAKYARLTKAVEQFKLTKNLQGQGSL